MAINLTKVLEKGNNISLSKIETTTPLTKLIIGLGWDTQQASNGQAFDLDAQAFLLSSDGLLSSETNAVYYNNLVSTDGSTTVSKDDRTGEGEGDDEVINIDLLKVSADVQKIDFTITIHEATERKQNFGQVRNAYVRVINPDSGDVLIRYDLTEDFSTETLIFVASLYRHNGEWKFRAFGEGHSRTLQEYIYTMLPK